MAKNPIELRPLKKVQYNEHFRLNSDKGLWKLVMDDQPKGMLRIKNSRGEFKRLDWDTVVEVVDLGKWWDSLKRDVSTLPPSKIDWTNP